MQGKNNKKREKKEVLSNRLILGVQIQPEKMYIQGAFG